MNKFNEQINAFDDQMNKIAEVCSKKEFTARELFNAFDVNGDGVITKEDLRLLAKSDENKKHFSKNDLKNLYSQLGKKVCQGVCQIIEDGSGEDAISIDDLLKALDKNGDGKVKFGEFLRIAKKDGNLMFITQDEFDEELEGLWKKPEEHKGFIEKLFS